jgi:GNAT superfamily N-acetyltransferase
VRAFEAPVPLARGHDLSPFDSGKPALDNWLKNLALRSEGKSARCYVVCRQNVVVAYHCLASGAIDRDTAAAEPLRKAMPPTLPIMLIGRLAVDKRYQGQGLGAGLLKDALQRILAASKEVGARAVLVHAIDDEAVAFYKRYGFKVFPPDTRSLYLPIEDIAAALG